MKQGTICCRLIECNLPANNAVLILALHLGKGLHAIECVNCWGPATPLLGQHTAALPSALRVGFSVGARTVVCTHTATLVKRCAREGFVQATTWNVLPLFCDAPSFTVGCVLLFEL
jgi:hypothetical protein